MKQPKPSTVTRTGISDTPQAEALGERRRFTPRANRRILHHSRTGRQAKTHTIQGVRFTGDP